MIYDNCKDKTEYSILNYMVQFQVVRDMSSEQMLGLFDKKVTKVESVDLCRCFVIKFKKLSDKTQKQALTNIEVIDNQLVDELRLFAKKGVLGRIKYGDEYQKIESFITQLPKVNQLIIQSSENKFQQQQCL